MYTSTDAKARSFRNFTLVLVSWHSNYTAELRPSICRVTRSSMCCFCTFYILSDGQKTVFPDLYLYFTALYSCTSQSCNPIFHSPLSLYFTALYPCISQSCIPVFHSPVFHSPVSMYFTALYLSGQCRPAHRWLACVHAEDGAGWVHEWWQSAAYGGK